METPAHFVRYAGEGWHITAFVEGDTAVIERNWFEPAIDQWIGTLDEIDVENMDYWFALVNTYVEAFRS